MSTVAELLVSIGANTKQFDKAIKRTEKSLKNMGKKLTDMGEKMTKGLTLPLAGVGFAAGSVAADTDAATGKIQAQLGTTAEEAEKLGGIAEEVWKNAFGTSLDEVATSLTTVKRNMKGVADTDLQGLTESAYVLQDAFGADITQSTKTAGTMMQNFGIDGQKAFDLMTIGFTEGGDKSGELLDSMNEYGGQFASMGLSAEDMLNILITGADDGAFSIDKVGDAVKEFNIRAKDGSDATAEGFSAIGLKAGEMGLAIAEGGIKGKEAFDATIAGLAAMTDPLAQQQAGVALFGTQWEDIGKTVILAMDTTTNKLGEVDGATKRTGDALNDNFGTRLTGMWRNAQSALEPLGDILLSLADEWLPKISTAIESVVNWFTNLSPGIQKLIVIVGIVVAAIGPLLIAFGFIISAVSAMIPVLAFLVSPIGLIIAAVVLLAILIIANWETIKTVTITVWNAIADFFVTLWEDIKAVLTTAWEGIKQFFIDYWPLILGIFTGGLGLLVGLLIQNWDEIKAKLEEVWNGVKQFFSDTWDGIESTAEDVWNSIKDFFGLLWDDIVWIFENLTLAGILITHWDEITATIEDVWNGIKKFMGDLWDGLSNKASEVFGGIRDALGGIWDDITDKVESVWEGITNTIKNSINSVIDLINSFIGKFNGIKISIPRITIPSVTIAGVTIGGGSIGGQSYGVPQIPNIPRLATGTNNVPQDMFAMLHEGEGVVPKKYNNNQGNGGPVTIIVEMDGRQIAKGSAPHIVREIRLKTGLVT